MKWTGRTYRKQKVCLMCGVPIPHSKRFFCSEECVRKANRIRRKNDKKNAREAGMDYADYIRGLRDGDE